jgi:hypothetical protein
MIADARRLSAYDHLFVAVGKVPRRSFEQIVALVSKAWLSGELEESQYERLLVAADNRRELLAARRRVSLARPAVVATAARPRDARTKRQGKRRAWSASGALPPHLRSHFTPGENAVAAVVRAEVRRNGCCSLSYAAIAKSAGLQSTTVVKRFMRMAAARELIKIKVRPTPGGRHKTNVVTIHAADWKRWNDLPMGKVGGGTNVPSYQNTVLKTLSQTAPEARTERSQWGLGTGGSGNAKPSHYQWWRREKRSGFAVGKAAYS